MTKTFIPKLTLILSVGLFLALISCKENNKTTSDTLAVSEANSQVSEPATTLSEDFKDYWYNGEAEITSYKLKQARYGEMREGKAVLIYVTEDFLPKQQVKANTYSATNIPILKLNATKNFNTGIYPYSIMESIFYPVENNQHALKVSASVQEWCGHIYTQLNNRDKFEVMSHSYFQDEADRSFDLEKTWTENELWTKLRIDPKSLPTGQLDIIPSLEHTRLNHDDFKAYHAFAQLENSSYTISYPELNRILRISFNSNFPYDILGWEETSTSGFGATAKTLTTTATKLKTIKTAYWNKKSNADLALRETLKLP